MSEQQMKVWRDTAFRLGDKLAAELMRDAGIPLEQAMAVLVRVPKGTQQ